MTSFIFLRRALLTVFLAVAVVNVYAAETMLDADTAKIEEITGLKGSLSKDKDVFKVSKPRTDVDIKVNQWSMPAFMGLTSWAAFTPATDGRTMMMGDTVVFEDEVNPAMSAALDAGLEVTALHNHFFYDQPKVYFMHIGGTGDISHLASGVRKVYDKIAEVRSANKTPVATLPLSIPEGSQVSPAPLEAIFGMKGETKDGMFKVTVGREATMNGVPVGSDMGVNTWAAFAGSDDQAVVDGDFAVQEQELQSVLKALRDGGIIIVAIHQHMTQEEPRYIFFHYWGQGKAQDLAITVKKGLAQQATSAVSKSASHNSVNGALPG